MRILLALTYYRPHISGLTIYVQRLAQSLATAGHRVTVLTSRYHPELPAEEQLGGVRVVRVPVSLRISKGVLMPGYLTRARRLIREHDLVVGSLPATPVEAVFLPLLARLPPRRPSVFIYHCDVRLPPGLANRLIEKAVGLSNLLGARLCDRLVAYTADYAAHSPVLRHFGHKIRVIPPPVEMPVPTGRQLEAMRARYGLDSGPLIGFVARLASEKGVEYALRAITRVRGQFPGVRILFAGDSETVIGEERYRQRLQPLLEEHAAHWTFTSVLDPEDPGQLASLYALCDVTILPSINETESFGLVQVESMLCGTPVVASDLPGVRQPVRTTGMGRLVPPRDPEALAEAIIEVLRQRERYVKPRAYVEERFSLRRTAQAYEELVAELVPARNGDAAPSGDRGEADLRQQLHELPAFRALLRTAECRLLRESGPLPQPVLDLGCGDGHFGALAIPAERLYGIDLSPAVLREARGQGAYAGNLAADAAALPFASGSLGTVVANSVLEHVRDLGGALAEIHRVLQPGGRLILSVPGHRFGEHLLGSHLARRLGLHGLARAYGRWFNSHSRHLTLLPPQGWLELLGEHGLEVEDWEGYMSPAALRAFDLAHYLSLPRLLSRKLTGRWVAFPNPIAERLFLRWLGPHVREESPAEGAYIFIRARKRSGGG